MKFSPCGLLFVSILFAPLLSTAATPQPLPDDPGCTPADRFYMEQAYELARKAAQKGNAPFGALLVVDRKVVAEFQNEVATSGDVTRHAETGLISQFGPKLGREMFRRAALYASNEPCIMCTGAILNAGILKVVYGTTESQFQKIIGNSVDKDPLTCRKIIARTNPGVKVYGPLMEKEGLAIHQAYWPEEMKKWGRK